MSDTGIRLSRPLLLCEDNPSVPYTYNGKTYYFNSLNYYKSVVRECNANNVSVTVQMLLNWPEGHEDLINEGARVPGKLFYSWNIYSNSAREKMEAMFCYLGMVFSQKDCYVSNWILGNEVNTLPAGIMREICQKKFVLRPTPMRSVPCIMLFAASTPTLIFSYARTITGAPRLQDVSVQGRPLLTLWSI